MKNVNRKSLFEFGRIVFNYLKMDKVLNGETAKDYEEDICAVCKKQFQLLHYHSNCGMICDDCLDELANIS